MKKDILKGVMAIGCIILALFTSAYLNDLEYKKNLKKSKIHKQVKFMKII